jgi:glycosyltransferase involved in cell wall biosynthesis
MKDLVYIGNIRLPTEKAHGIQIMKMCEAFSSQGRKVELVIPTRKNSIQIDPFEYYSVKNNFKIKRVWTIDTVEWGWLGFWIESFTFAFASSFYLLSRKSLFYTRDEVVACIFSCLGKKVIWEAHTGQKNLLVRFLIYRKVPFVVITKSLKDLYVKLGVSENKIFISPDGVDLDQFSIDISKEEAKQKVGLSDFKKIILYTGSLYSWKGVDTLVEAAKLSDSDYIFVFVGGSENHVDSFKEKYSEIKNLFVVGRKSYKEIPIFLKSADILIIPNSGKKDLSSLYTSPMKLFEYMASGRPIIASNLPSIREILDDSTGYFFESDNPHSLSQAIKDIFENYSDATEKAKEALSRVKSYTWLSRSEKILKFIEE